MSKPTKIKHLVPTVLYRRKGGAWVIQRSSLYAVPEHVFEFARAWPALVEKRQLSAVQRRELQVLRIAV